MGYTRKRPEHLAAKLLGIRRQLGVSQIKMAKLLDYEAYHRISEFESGRREPNLMLLLRYARVANVSVDLLIDDDIALSSSTSEQMN